MKFFRRTPLPEPVVPAPSAAERQAALVAQFDALCQLVNEKGAHFRRDFGHWVRLRLAGERFLELDSYGHNLGLKVGSGEYGRDGYFVGFEGSKPQYLGTHFGAPSVHATADELDELTVAAQAAVDQHTGSDPQLRRRV